MCDFKNGECNGRLYGDISECRLQEVMTEEELIQYLRLDTVSSASDLSNVVMNLRKMRGLPCVHICRKCLYVKKAIDEWLNNEAT